MANERAWNYRNTGTKESPVWEKWFQKTVADAVYMDDTGDKDIIQYIQEQIDELIGGAPGTYDTLKEIADYIAAHEEVAEALNQAITEKAPKIHTHAASNVIQDATHRFVTDTEKNTWNNKAANTAFGGASSSAAGTTGLVPAPAEGDQEKYLKADGTWGTPPDTDTTYGNASTSAAGLMSAADKEKLDGIAEEANKYTHPSNHAASMITQDATHRFVTDTEKEAWSAKAEIYFASELPSSADTGAVCFLI